eukprot:1160406-Pelagomonas_calceolata.AAC.3
MHFFPGTPPHHSTHIVWLVLLVKLGCAGSASPPGALQGTHASGTQMHFFPGTPPYHSTHIVWLVLLVKLGCAGSASPAGALQGTHADGTQMHFWGTLAEGGGHHC